MGGFLFYVVFFPLIWWPALGLHPPPPLARWMFNISLHFQLTVVHFDLIKHFNRRSPTERHTRRGKGRGGGDINSSYPITDTLIAHHSKANVSIIMSSHLIMYNIESDTIVLEQQSTDSRESDTCVLEQQSTDSRESDTIVLELQSTDSRESDTIGLEQQSTDSRDFYAKVVVVSLLHLYCIIAVSLLYHCCIIAVSLVYFAERF